MFKRVGSTRDGYGWNFASYHWKWRKNPLKRLRHYKQRAQKGYSYTDWWSFDTYIAGVVANACEDFKSGHGLIYGTNEEEMNEFLDSIAKPLARYAENKFEMFDRDEEEKMYEDAKEAMKKFGENLGRFWD